MSHNSQTHTTSLRPLTTAEKKNLHPPVTQRIPVLPFMRDQKSQCTSQILASRTFTRTFCSTLNRSRMFNFFVCFFLSFFSTSHGTTPVSVSDVVVLDHVPGRDWASKASRSTTHCDPVNHFLVPSCSFPDESHKAGLLPSPCTDTRPIPHLREMVDFGHSTPLEAEESCATCDFAHDGSDVLWHVFSGGE